MKRFLFGSAAACMVLGAALAVLPSPASTAPRDRAEEVRASERAFAKTMADRDLKSFGGYIAVEGVFFGRSGAIRGRKAVVEAWTKFFDGPDAPFSWDPETIEVLKSGRLALSSGPVKDPKGAVIGTFSTIWRLEPDGKWRVVFDKGCPVCEPEKSGS